VGVSGYSSDFRDLTSAANEGNERADLAVNMFYYSVKKLIAAYAAAMGGIDALVFTGGIGENDAAYRLAITEGLEFMGIKLDREKNNVRGIKRDVSAEDAKVRTLVIPTNEELMIALDTKRLIEK
ncbi:MAG: acetate kinase, partial [Selenomonadaceae bacterium]|nr:acetate kinase [Selenomonadaceae bacterium]